jgi:AraC-like DNA-binding protein
MRHDRVTQRLPSAPVRLVEDADGYERAVNGVSVRTVRLGAGAGPNRVASTDLPSVKATAVQAGFPMAARGECLPDKIYAAAILTAPPGTRWCDRDLTGGDVIVYGPSKRHTAVNPTGTRFAFGAIDVESLEIVSDEMGLDPTWPGEDEMMVFRGPHAHVLQRVIPAVVNPTARTTGSLERELLCTVVEALSGAGALGGCRRIDNGSLVIACLEYAERVQRVPSIDELCAMTFVCRRKLWEAFDERYRRSPGRFLRGWGLARAYDCLRAADPATTSVSAVAADLGFGHAGRFASHYEHAFGEQPSQTLRRTGYSSPGLVQLPAPRLSRASG